MFMAIGGVKEESKKTSLTPDYLEWLIIISAEMGYPGMSTGESAGVHRHKNHHQPWLKPSGYFKIYLKPNFFKM